LRVNSSRRCCFQHNCPCNVRCSFSLRRTRTEIVRRFQQANRGFSDTHGDTCRPAFVTTSDKSDRCSWPINMIVQPNQPRIRVFR
jgi:hypothetical protein